MDFLIPVLNMLLPGLYGIVALGYAALFFTKGESRFRVVTELLMPVALVHFAYLVLRTYHLQHIPLLSRPEAMTSIAFALVVVYLAQERPVRSRSVGVFVIAPAFLFQLISSLTITHVSQADRPLFQGGLFRFHVFSSVLAYVGFALAAFYAILFLFLFREIHSRDFRFFFSRLPALETLSRMNYRTVVLAFILFTLGIVTGSIWAARSFAAEALLDPHNVGSLLVWMLYAFMIFRLWGRWPGRQGAVLSLVGFGAIVLLFTILSFVFPTYHDYQ